MVSMAIKMHKITIRGCKRLVHMMNESSENNGSREEEKELVNILIDSDLYLDMNLVERYRLLHFLMASYYQRHTIDKG
jgi:hypothetical protein